MATYKYDENGRRIYSNETYYRYDGTSNHVLFEENAKGEITKAYTYDDNGQPLTMTYGGATYYYLTNYREDVLALTDESGTSVAKYTYDAWGNILTQKYLEQNDKVKQFGKRSNIIYQVFKPILQKVINKYKRR